MNKNNKFLPKHFNAPPTVCYPAYFWLWNDKLTKKELFGQLQDMYHHKALSVCPHPIPMEFRPEVMATQMYPAYLSKQFFRLYKAVASEIRRLGMDLWLYDEGGWPSGGACGRIVKQKPSLACKILKLEKVQVPKGSNYIIPANVLCCWTGVNTLRPGETFEAKESPVEIKICKVVEVLDRNEFTPLYPDLLNHNATRDFIKTTHEQYKACLGKDFKVITKVFTDEPSVQHVCPQDKLPWTDDFLKIFANLNGYDIVDHLQAIFSHPEKILSPKDMKARIDYFNTWSTIFTSSYFGNIQKWCRKNRVFSSGHIGGEDDTLGCVKYGFGSALRALRKLDIPGVDAISRQIFPGKQNHALPSTLPNARHKGNSNTTESLAILPGQYNHYFPKYASSVAHQQGNRWIVSESFGVYGNGLTIEQMKWVTDYQFVRGVNLLVITNYPYSTRNHLMGGVRPHFGRVNPLWDYMDDFHLYAARLGYLLSIGTPIIRDAVYNPICDLWAGGKEASLVADSQEKLANVLLENQIDFDLIDDDVLGDLKTKVIDGRLRVGKMLYERIWMPKTNWISTTAMQKLSAFIEQGGIINVVQLPKTGGVEGGDLRQFVNSKNNINILNFQNIRQFAKPIVTTEKQYNDLRICGRRFKDNEELYFITNEGLTSINPVVSFAQKKPAFKLDLETGTCHKFQNVSYSKNHCHIQMNLPFNGSIVVFFGNWHGRMLHSVFPKNEPVMELKDEWKYRPVSSYIIEKGDLHIKESQKQKFYTGLGDWRTKLGEGFSGHCEYLLKFDCPESVLNTAYFLNLGEVRYACKVFLNGVYLGKKSWAPFVFMVKGQLNSGANQLKIIVTNTLANQLIRKTANLSGPKSKIGPPSPYHKIELEYEKDSLPSGLFGPITLI